MNLDFFFIKDSYVIITDCVGVFLVWFLDVNGMCRYSGMEFGDLNAIDYVLKIRIQGWMRRSEHGACHMLPAIYFVTAWHCLVFHVFPACQVAYVTWHDPLIYMLGDIYIYLILKKIFSIYTKLFFTYF